MHLNVRTAEAEDLQVELAHLFIIRYVSMAGAAVLVYDTLLTLSEEIRLVWAILFGSFQNISKRMLLARTLHLFARYIMIAISVVTIIAFVSPVDNQWCKRAIRVISIADVSIEITASGVVFYRLYSLWHFERRTALMLIAIFVIGKTTSFVATIATVDAINDGIMFLDLGSIRTCFTTETSKWSFAVFAPAVVSDLLAIGLLVLIALLRPRLESQRLLDILYRDGLIFFITVICMRLLNLILTATGPFSLSYLGIVFSGTLVTTVSSRSFLILFRHNDPSDEESEEFDADSSYLPIERAHSSDPSLRPRLSKNKLGLGHADDVSESCSEDSTYLQAW